MKPRQAVAYLKGIRAAKNAQRRCCRRAIVNPYEQEVMRVYFDKGVCDWADYPADCEYFLKQAEGRV